MSLQLPASYLNDPAFLQQPALKPPSGVIPNFTNPASQGPMLIIVGAILLAFVVIALVNRAYTKIYIFRKASWDDLTVSLSAVGAIVLYTVCVMQIQAGVIGKHQYEVRVGNIAKKSFIIPEYVSFVLNGPTLWITKLSFFLFYLGIFRPMKYLRLCIYSGAILSTVFYWSVSIALFVLASPTPGETWAEKAVLSQTQYSTKANTAIAAGGLLVDIWLFIIPLVGIYRLQLHRTRKLGLIIMFSTGLIAIAASALSIYFRYKLNHIEDKTWAALDFELLFLIETEMGIITACMPTFAKMLRHHLPPWAILKHRLKFSTPPSPKEGSKRDQVTVCKRSEPINFYGKKLGWGDRLYMDDTISSAGMELESLESVEDCDRHGIPDTFDDDRIVLKQHDPQQK